MSSHHRRVRRCPVFLGCEGESEQAYCQLLADMLCLQAINVHLEVVLIGEGAGDPLAKIRKAIKKVDGYETKRSVFWKKAVLIDSDIAETGNGQAAAEKLAEQHGIMIIWQTPCHEAFLLRHLPDCKTHRPPTSSLARSALEAKWPAYKKPMNRRELSQWINKERINQAISVETGAKLS